MATDHSQASPNELSSILTPLLLKDVRDFWFEGISDEAIITPGGADMARWFKNGAELDAQCTERYHPSLEKLRLSQATADDVLAAVQPTDPLDWLSLVLLLDQIPRNCYRGEAAAVVFSYFDQISYRVAKAAIDKGIPDHPPMKYRLLYRMWFCIPSMHTEDMAIHESSLELYNRMEQDLLGDAARIDPGDEDSLKCRGMLAGSREEVERMVKLMRSFAVKHYDIIKDFGRYPHRNRPLGREMTAAEQEYLDNGGETFGG